MEKRDVVGMEARTPDGEGIGRISEVLRDEETGEVTRVVLERGDQRFEVPVSAVEADEDADFATFHADRSDEEPGDHTGDEEKPEGLTPLLVEDGGPDDAEDEGQFVTIPDEEDEEVAPEELVREDWQDEEDTPDSGYPRNDAYLDPDSGKEEAAPEFTDNETVRDDIEDLLTETNLNVVSAENGVVALGGSIGSQGDLEVVLEEIMGLDGVLEIDVADVEV